MDAYVHSPKPGMHVPTPEIYRVIHLYQDELSEPVYDTPFSTEHY
jgi:hypothetical protein